MVITSKIKNSCVQKKKKSIRRWLSEPRMRRECFLKKIEKNLRDKFAKYAKLLKYVDSSPANLFVTQARRTKEFVRMLGGEKLRELRKNVSVPFVYAKKKLSLPYKIESV